MALFLFQLRGMYLARQLSFAGVTFRVEEVPLTKDFIQMYDEAARLVSINRCSV